MRVQLWSRCPRNPLFLAFTFTDDAMTIPKTLAAATAVFAIGLIVAGFSNDQRDIYVASALAVFTIGFFATGAVPAHIASIWFFIFAVVTQIVPTEAIFSGFASMGFWMVFGGLLIGAAVRETGLGRRIAGAMTAGFGRSYTGNIGGIVTVGVALAFFVPSTMGRVVILMPIVLELAENQGFESGSRGRDGFVIALLFGTLLPAFALLPSNLPNIILTGAAAALHGITLNYGEYLVLHFPLLGVLKAILIIGLIVAMFSETPSREVPKRPRVPFSREERRLAVILGATLLLWMTDSLHGVAPGWIGLAAGSACLLPGVGILKADVVNKLNYEALLYVAGIIGLGAMISTSGLGDRVGLFLLDVLGFSPGESMRNLGAMTGISIVTGFLATQAGVPAILTPISGGIAEAMDLPLATVLMMQVLGFSSVVLPYQVPPLMVGLSLGGISVATATRFSLTLFVPTVLILLPLDYFWWRILGYLP